MSPLAGRTREALQQTATNAAMIPGGTHTVMPFIGLGATYHLNASNPDIDWQGDHHESGSDHPFFQLTYGPLYSHLFSPATLAAGSTLAHHILTLLQLS